MIFSLLQPSSGLADEKAKQPLFVFNSDGGAAAIAHVKGKPVRDVVCRELDELKGTAITDFFWCPIVGGNVFIYPTKVGEVMGDNIRDWDKIHPYYREQGRAMAANLKQLIRGGNDPIDMLAKRAKEMKIRFWLTCRMNEIHEDDDRFMVLRSRFKEKNPDLIHGKNYHPEAVYAPIKKFSYAWDYGKERVRNHFLALFREWLQYDINGIELDYCRSPCLFPPGQERVGAGLLTDFMTKLKAEANRVGKKRGHQIKIAVRIPPTLKRCRDAGIDIRTWISRGLVDLITPMDRGYFHAEPSLSEFIAMAKPKGVPVLGGIEPKVRNYRQNNRLNFAATSSFLHQGTDGIYLFNYDCHRLKARSSKYGGVLQDYTKEELFFLQNALNSKVRNRQNKLHIVSHDSGNHLADDGGSRPLRCRLPVGKPKAFRMTVGDDINGKGKRPQTRLVVTLKDCLPRAEELLLTINGLSRTPFLYEADRASKTVSITVVQPPMRRGSNSITVGLKSGSKHKGTIYKIDFHVDYTKRTVRRKTASKPAKSPTSSGTSRPKLPALGPQQLFAYPPQSLEFYIKEPRHERNATDWPANVLRFQFPESFSAYNEDGKHMWEYNFEKSKHRWNVTQKANEKTMGGQRKNRVMTSVDTMPGKVSIHRSVTWSPRQLDLNMSIKNIGKEKIVKSYTSMCLQRTAAPDYYDRRNQRTFLVSSAGFLASKELVFHPQKLMFYGQVDQPLSLVARRGSKKILKEPALFVVSPHKRYVLCYAWRGATRVFMNRSGRCRCLHSDLTLTDIAPQQEIKVQGVIFVHQGTLQQAYARYLKWKKQK